MSNSNYYGHIDRRRKIPLEEFRVRDVYDAVMEEYETPLMMHSVGHGVVEDIERLTLRRASRAVEGLDRVEIAEMVNTLKKKLNIGTDAALHILAHVGVYLSRVS